MIVSDFPRFLGKIKRMRKQWIPGSLFPPPTDSLGMRLRGIVLGSCVAKVLVKLLSRRLGTFAEEEILTETQGGFRSERRCADQILTFRSVCELRRKENKGPYMAFLDISKGYDTVWHEVLRRKIPQYGVDEKFVHICRGFYKGINSLYAKGTFMCPQTSYNLAR